MKYLLLDIDDTLAPWGYKGRDSVHIQKHDIDLRIPTHLAEWFAKVHDNQIKIIWSTDRDPTTCSIIEKKLGFKPYGKIKFTNPKVYPNWPRLFGIIKFCDDHSEDIVMLADNDIIRGTKNVKKLPDNLHLIIPSDTRRGCLSESDMELVDSI